MRPRTLPGDDWNAVCSLHFMNMNTLLMSIYANQMVINYDTLTDA